MHEITTSCSLIASATFSGFKMLPVTTFIFSLISSGIFDGVRTNAVTSISTKFLKLNFQNCEILTSLFLCGVYSPCFINALSSTASPIIPFPPSTSNLVFIFTYLQYRCKTLSLIAHKARFHIRNCTISINKSSFLQTDARLQLTSYPVFFMIVC